MIRLIAADLDGTLISEGNRCDPSTSAVLKELKKSGILFAVCTGRPVSSMRHMLEGWGLEEVTDYIVGSNGGEVLDTATGELTRLNALSTDTVREIIDLYEPLGLIPSLYAGPVVYVERQSADTERIGERVGVEIRTGHIREMLKEPQPKYMFILDPALMEKAERFAAEHPDPRYAVFKTSYDLLEMTAHGMNKSTGMRWIMEKEGIRKDEVIAFGDNTNDIPMFAEVRYSVCVDNGTPDAKAAASYITESMENNGFAKWLEGHLRNGEITEEGEQRI